jgi:hypothetical protein
VRPADGLSRDAFDPVWKDPDIYDGTTPESTVAEIWITTDRRLTCEPTSIEPGSAAAGAKKLEVDPRVTEPSDTSDTPAKSQDYARLRTDRINFDLGCRRHQACAGRV